MITNRKWVAS